MLQLLVAPWTVEALARPPRFLTLSSVLGVEAVRSVFSGAPLRASAFFSCGSYRTTMRLRVYSFIRYVGVEQARRDDLEGLGYVLIYFLRGSLPWQGLKATSKRDKYSKITHTKMNVDISSLCEGLPSCFAEFLAYCRALQFTDAPNCR